MRMYKLKRLAAEPVKPINLSRVPESYYDEVINALEQIYSVLDEDSFCPAEIINFITDFQDKYWQRDNPDILLPGLIREAFSITELNVLAHHFGGSIFGTIGQLQEPGIGHVLTGVAGAFYMRCKSELGMEVFNDLDLYITPHSVSPNLRNDFYRLRAKIWTTLDRGRKFFTAVTRYVYDELGLEDPLGLEEMEL